MKTVRKGSSGHDATNIISTLLDEKLNMLKSVSPYYFKVVKIILCYKILYEKGYKLISFTNIEYFSLILLFFQLMSEIFNGELKFILWLVTF